MEATPPPFFKRGPSPAFRLGVFALLSIAIMVLDARFEYLEPARHAVSVVLYPLQQLAAAPVRLAGRIGAFFTDSYALLAENQRLRAEALAGAKLRNELEALRRENDELRALAAVRGRVPVDSLAAEVVYSARDPFSRKLVIDKGMADDVRAGVAVIDHEGVIGQVTRAYPFVSEVTQIIDKNHAVPVQNLRTGLRAIVFGNGREGTLDLRFMPVSADIQVGDTLVTSGIDGVYPPGLPVAKVVDIQRDASLSFARITCAPLSGVDRRSHVLVLRVKRELPERPPDTAEEEPVKRKKPRRTGP